MKKNVFLLMALVALAITSCDIEPTSDQVQQKQTEKALSEASRQIGMPAIVNYQEKKFVKWIYELCDQEDLVCHAYLFNEFNGEVGQYLGKCIGYGIPYSTQFSNPEKRMYNGSSYTMPQAEPNGLFKPEGLSATWLIMVDPKTGEPRPVYVEPSIIVSPFKLH